MAQPHAVQVTDVQKAFTQIAKYETVSPKRSLKLIEQFEPHVTLLPAHEQFNWYYTALMVANQLDDLNLTVNSLQTLADFPETTSTQTNRLNYLTQLGHYYNKTAHYQRAVSAYICAIDQTQNVNATIPLLYSVAVSFVLAENTAKGREILQQLADFLVITNAPEWRGLVFEALGVLALRNKRFHKAEQFFTDAMNAQQTSAHVGRELNSVLNLLLTFALHNDFDKFKRLESRAIRLNSLFNNNDLQIYLEWIQALQEVQQYGELRTITKPILLQRYSQIESQASKEAIQQHVADKLDIELPASPTAHQHRAELPHLDNLLKQFQCKPTIDAQQYLYQYLVKLNVD